MLKVHTANNRKTFGSKLIIKAMTSPTWQQYKEGTLLSKRETILSLSITKHHSLDKSIVAQLAEMPVAECSLMSCV